MGVELIYTRALGVGSNTRRHIIRASGTDATFPRSLCNERIALRDEPRAVPCRTCRTRALTELSLTLDALGLTDEAIAVATRINDGHADAELPVAG